VCRGRNGASTCPHGSVGIESFRVKKKSTGERTIACIACIADAERRERVHPRAVRKRALENFDYVASPDPPPFCSNCPASGNLLLFTQFRVRTQRWARNCDRCNDTRNEDILGKKSMAKPGWKYCIGCCSYKTEAECKTLSGCTCSNRCSTCAEKKKKRSRESCSKGLL